MEAPPGAPTLLFTDIEGSTELLRRLGDDFAQTLAAHHTIVRTAVAEHDGREIHTAGDGFFVLFRRATDGLRAAVAVQIALAGRDWPGGIPVRVRMGLHTGDVTFAGDEAVGLAIHQAARICAAAHGGQVLVSGTTLSMADGDFLTISLGEHLLKDLPQPVLLHQLNVPGLPTEFPPLRSLNVLPNNLPRRLTTFIGRHKELRAVEKLLATERLVTLVGPGGCGKTSLAVAAATAVLANYEDGVWFADLALLNDANLVARTLGDALNLPDAGHRDFEEALVSYLARRHALVVLDNCEHVLDGCAELVLALLSRTDRVGVLTTSQAVLDVAGETVYPVGSLQLPTPDAAMSEAVQLFYDRAARVRPDFTVTDDNVRSVQEICTRLDGLPLAIELAASRVRSMSPREIALHLDERFAFLGGTARGVARRHQTLAAALEWSLEHCTNDERTVFVRLACFVGTFTAAAAEAVCADEDLPKAAIADILDRLVTRSLLMAQGNDETRYRLLETMREYGRRVLTASGEDHAVRTRHLDWYVTFAEACDQGLHSADDTAWLRRLDEELENVRAALDWAYADADPAAGLDLACRLFSYWEHRPYRTEIVGRVRELSTLLPDDDIFRRAWAGYMSVWLEREINRTTDADTLLIHRTDPRAHPWIAGGLVLRAREIARQDPDGAVRLLDEAESILPPNVDPGLSHNVRIERAIVSLVSGEPDTALSQAADMLARARSLSERADILYQLGRINFAAGSFADAAIAHGESIAMWDELGMKMWAASGRQHLANAHIRLGQPQKARARLGEAILLFGDWALSAEADALIVLGTLDRDLGLYSAAHAGLRRAGNVSDQFSDRARVGGASVDVVQGRFESARLELDSLLRSHDARARTEAGIWRATLSLHDGDHAAALDSIDGAIADTAENPSSPWSRYAHNPWFRLVRGRILAATGDLAGGVRDLHRAVEIAARGDGSLPYLAEAFEAMGQTLAGHGDPRTATLLLAAAEVLRRHTEAVVHPVERPGHEAALVRARESDRLFDVHWNEGLAMPVQEVVALAAAS